jgi:hypothetical protein
VQLILCKINLGLYIFFLVIFLGLGNNELTWMFFMVKKVFFSVQYFYFSEYILRSMKRFTEMMLSLQIRQLDETANRLMQTHPETAEQTYAKQREINEEWTALTAKANRYRENITLVTDLLIEFPKWCFPYFRGFGVTKVSSKSQCSTTTNMLYNNLKWLLTKFM